MTLPMGREGVVRARYFIFLILLFIANLFMFLFGGVLIMLKQDSDWMSLGITAVFALMGGGLLSSVAFPICYRYGSARARTVFIFPLMLITLMIAFSLTRAVGVFGTPDTWLSEMQVLQAAAAGVPVSLGGLYLSYRLSCSIVNGKEY